MIRLSLTLCVSMSMCCPQGPCAWSNISNGISTPPGYTISVRDMVSFDDGTGPALYIGGVFATAGGIVVNNIAKWQGGTWEALGSGLGHPLVSGNVYALAVFDDGNGPALYAGGTFSFSGLQPIVSLARWNGTTWVGVINSNPLIYELAVANDGTGPKLYVGGSFNASSFPIAPNNSSNIVAWDGATWSSLGPQGVSGDVYAIREWDDGAGRAVYACGQFTFAGGLQVNRIARWRNATWSSLGSGFDGGNGLTAESLAVYDDGTGPGLYVGGAFAGASGVAVNGIARWNGNVWSSVGGGVGPWVHLSTYVDELTVFDDGGGPALFAGGRFTTAGGVVVAGLGKWDGASWLPVGTGLPCPLPPVTGSCIFVSGLGVHHGSAGADLFAYGAANGPGSNGVPFLANLTCGSTISLSSTQPGGPGAPVFVAGANLTPGHEYFSVFSFDLCPGGPGTGSTSLLGLCTNNVQALLVQLLAPVGESPLHFVAAHSYESWGPYLLGPAVLDGITLDATGGFLGALSPVGRFTIQ